MKLRFTTIIFAVITFVFINSCKEDQPVEPEPDETIIADNTTQADSNTFKSGLVSIDSAHIVYSSSNSFTQSLIVGGFIVSDYGEGILRKIESIQTQGDQVVLGTRQARLDEVIIKGKIEFSGPINPEEMILESTSHDDFIIEKTKTDLFVSFPHVTFSGSQNLEINAATTFSNPKLTFILEFDNGVKAFKTYLEVTNESSIEVITTSTVNVSGSFIPPWAQFVLPPIPTPILVPIIPKLQFGIGGEIGIEQISTSELSCVTTTKTGFQLVNLLPSPIFELDTDANATSDLDILGGYFKSYLIFPKVGFYVTGLLGPFFRQQVYGKVDVKEDAIGTYTRFSWGLFGEGGVEFDLLGYLQAGVKVEIYDTDWELWKNYLNGGSIPCPGIPTVNYEGKTYNTVLIGAECWLKENLDVGTMVTGTQNQTDNGIIEKYCYDNNPINCETYGGLYQWHEAMQYVTTHGAKGICPQGWHIPYGEFSRLVRTVFLDGNALKAIGQGTGEGAGTNTSGFSALLGGFRDAPVTFRNLGETTIYWKSDDGGGNFFRAMRLNHNSGIIGGTYGFIGADNGFNIRCVKTDGVSTPQQPTLSSPFDNATNVLIPPTLYWNANFGTDNYTLQVSTNSSFTSFIYNQSGLANTEQQISGLNNSTQYYWRVNASNSYGTSGWSDTWSFTTSSGGSIVMPCPGIPTVNYEGKTYNTVLIGAQCWLKENLDIGTMINGSQDQSNNGTIEKYCYDNDPANCTTYGGLYQWDEAMQYSTTLGSQGICPPGWHIPTYAELHTLSQTVYDDAYALLEIGQGNGTNTSGFTALYSGVRNQFEGFVSLDHTALFWGSMQLNIYDKHCMILGQSNIIFLQDNPKPDGLSVRCIKD